MQGAGGGGGETSAIALLAQGNSTIQLLAQVGGQLEGEGCLLYTSPSPRDS